MGRHDSIVTASPCRPVTPPWPGPPRAGLTASLPACNRCSIRWLLLRKRVPHLTVSKHFQRQAKRSARVLFCDTSRKESLRKGHTRQNPASTEQPGPRKNRSRGRVCTKPPLSSVFCPDLSGILFQCLMGLWLSLLYVWH